MLLQSVFVQGTATINQLLHIGYGFAGTMLSWLGAFMLGRMEFVEHYPASAIAGLAVNAFIGWWLTHARPRVWHRRRTAIGA